MEDSQQLTRLIARIEERLDAMDKKLDKLTTSRRKSFEWIERMSEHVNSLDAFREEVRATFEPLNYKLRDLDEVMRIIRHATSDVARRITDLEGVERRAG